MRTSCVYPTLRTLGDVTDCPKPQGNLPVASDNMPGVDTLCLAELPNWHAHGFVWSSAYERVALPSLGNARAGKPALLQPVAGASLRSEHWAHTLADKMNLLLRPLLPRPLLPRLAAPSLALPRLVSLSPALSSLSLSLVQGRDYD